MIDELKPEVTVTGVASFDGDLNENKSLALKRASAVVDKIKKKYPKIALKVEGKVVGPAGEIKDTDALSNTWKETLKQLNLPNPPKSFVKSKKQFSTYYQIQIN